MKSEVKKKMMLHEQATHTPKSLKRAQVENFFAGNLLIGSADMNSQQKLEGNLTLPPGSSQGLMFKKQTAKRAATCATEFILFRFSTSIMTGTKIIAGAYKWLLSTMSSSFPAVALR